MELLQNICLIKYWYENVLIFNTDVYYHLYALSKIKSKATISHPNWYDDIFLPLLYNFEAPS